MEYLAKDDVELALRDIGLHEFTVAFDKKDGGYRIMTGVLQGVIQGRLLDTVVMITEDGIRSFNTNRVTQIGLSKVGEQEND